MSSAEETINRGRQASFLLSALSPRITEHEGKIIDRLVAKYYSGKLTDRDIIGGIAAIGELRSFVRDLEVDRKKGQEAETQEHRT